jgi:DNA-binding response OmpR family regulator
MLIAILEDDISQRELLSHWLTVAGYDARSFAQGQMLLRAMALESFDMLMLDWNVPDVAGIDVLKRVREHSKVPVLFCTARDAVADVVKALREGADDYLIKPLRRLELLARIEAVIRRSRKVLAYSEGFRIGNFQVDWLSGTMARDAIQLNLSAYDFDLAVLFLQNVGRIVSRRHIQQAVWGLTTALNTRTIDNHISRIRIKLELVPEHGWQLKSIFGRGYRLDQVQPPGLLSSFERVD